jgi:hypothetical protein
MTSTSIIRGKFAKGDKQKGNFTGWNASGEQIFIPKAMMNDDLKWKKDEDVKFPFFAIFNTQTIGVTDPLTGAVLPNETTTRETVSFVSLDEDERDNVAIADALTKVKQGKKLMESATEAGLNVETAQKLVQQSI